MAKNEPYDLPEKFYDFAMMPRFAEELDTLAGMAENEDWEYRHTPSPIPKPILKNYITHTYQRIAEEKKVAVSEDENFCCWNTGLITAAQEPIYMLLNRNRLDDVDSYWHFAKWVRQGEWELNRFVSLPDMAHYFEDPSVLVLDTRKDLRMNVEHVVADNVERFPEALRNMGAFGLQNIVSGARDAAWQRARRNYKTAIPQYYQGQVQLLVPLSLTDARRADLALVVERYPDFYRAATCLTLDMAYNNARQLARPDRDWLVP
ncbi:DUF3825 domain-containing protein [Brucella intermedia]|uniref:DUF3825 domain-containing protein n=1 Tax=Brucella intermedia TaxID=94625 RepID=UPI0034CE08BA